MKLSKNLITQIVSLILLAFTFSGLGVNPDETANTIVDYLSNGQYFALITYVMINLLNVIIHWINQLKTEPKKFWSFIESVNFWVAAINIVLGILLLKYGIVINPDDVKTFISLIFSKDYWEAGTVFIINILIPVLKILIPKENRK